MNASEILSSISQLRALVVGDICLDRWCMYDPSLAEPSRETGIPRIGVISYEATPGAGGTVANNLVAMGVRHVSVLGVQGDDGAAYELGRALTHRGIDGKWMVTTEEAQTFTYTKYLNIATGAEDLPRTDLVNVRPWSRKVNLAVTEQLRRAVEHADVILVSDQAETEDGGVVTGTVREELSRIAIASPKKLIWVDSRMRAEHFRDVIVKTNEEEALAVCARMQGLSDMDSLRRHTRAPLFVVTHGGDGVDLYTENGAKRVRTRRVDDPVDICGAGDSFSAGAAMAYAATGDSETAARFGNTVASVTIMKKGTGTASPDEILLAAEQMAL